jgi:hypothetical protein
MRKYVVTVVTIALLLFPISSHSGFAGFAIFQLNNASALPPAAVVCLVTTGNCTGTGGGSALFTAATCNGVADDSAAFSSFNNWAVNTWQASNSGLIELDIPHSGTCVFQGVGNCPDGTPCPGYNVKQLRIVGLGYSGNGDGATFAHGAPVSTGHGYFLGSFRGQFQDNAHSVRLVSSNIGDTCVTLLDATKASIFNAGDIALISGLDMQHGGFPTNPFFYERPQISSVDASHKCDGTTAGASVHFTVGLANKYLSTWPIYDAGAAFDADQGGPATLYALDQGFNTTQTYIGLTFDNPNFQTQSIGRNITFQNVKFTGGNCGIPTQNDNYAIVNADMSTCNVEMDKINGTVSYTNVTINQINFQSASVNQFNLTNSTVSSSQQGTPKKFTCSGSTIASLLVGAHSFGRTDEVNVGNCTVTAMTSSAVTDAGNGDGNGGTSSPGFNFTRTISSGTIKIANSVKITNAVDQGGGVVRLTLSCNTSLYPTCSDPTAGFATGLFYELANLAVGATFTGSISGSTLTVSSLTSGIIQVGAALGGTNVQTSQNIVSQLSGTTGGVGTYSITSSQPTVGSETMTTISSFKAGNYSVAATNSGAGTVDINFSGGLGGLTYVSGGIFVGTIADWAVPGTNMAFVGQFGVSTPYWQVTSVTQDGNFTIIGTTLSGGFPTIPFNNCPQGGTTCISASVHTAPKFTCSGCSGDINAVAFGPDPAHGPYGSYFQRVYTSATSTPTIQVGGNISSVDFNATAANTGGGTPTFAFASSLGPIVINSTGGSSRWNPLINNNLTGDRNVTLTGVTGTQTGDSGLAVPDSTQSLLIGVTPQYIGTCTGCSTTLTIQTNQGVVYPPSFP